MLSHFNWSKYFYSLYSTKLQQKIYLFRWYGAYLIYSFQFQTEEGSRTPAVTKIDFFVTNSQPLIVVAKNFIVDVTDMLDPPLSRLQTLNQSEPVQALDPLYSSCAK